MGLSRHLIGELKYGNPIGEWRILVVLSLSIFT